MPAQLESGILYYSEEFNTAAHLCACGCGAKIRTPIDDTEWSISETKDGPTLRPSVGNWQQKCQSHYFITRGTVSWEAKWSEEEILRGRNKEAKRRNTYYSALEERESGSLKKLGQWFNKFFK